MTDKSADYLTFVVESCRYAFPVSWVREIVELTESTPVPGMSPWMLGLVSIRGEGVPVVDLRRTFGLPVADSRGKGCVIILESEGDTESRRIGALVDAVEEVMHLDDSTISSRDSVESGELGSQILAVHHVEGRFIVVLEPAIIFSHRTEA